MGIQNRAIDISLGPSFIAYVVCRSSEKFCGLWCDFNDICFDSEKLGGNPRPLSQTGEFQETLDACSLHDLHGDDFYHSDHRPIIIELSGLQQLPVQSNTIFRLEQHWATEADFKDVVYRGWDKNNRVTTLPKCLKRCRDYLKAWVGTRFGVLEREIEELATKDELYLKQCRRFNWLASGNRNSKYFHVCASARRTKNLIRGLLLAHGDWCTEKSDMTEIVEHYLTNLFRSNNPTDDEMNMILNCAVKTIDEQVSSILCAPFLAAEVQKAVFDMHPDKVPGLDDMLVFFFQKIWDVIGEEVLEAILKILNDGAAIDDWNDTIVTLVPKIQTPITMKDFSYYPLQCLL
ncbi:uncharacterized protein [Primulina eburnea]|uniref:uncharacterized protein n=1 Tax=Primulina eburnea TaxID=1245227 RepID=UPI003C6C7B7C